jgi:uncharacterized protein involved in response to NO
MRRSTLVMTWLFGLVAVAFLVLLAIAGVPAATALLASAAGIIVMIALGGIVGGRHTPRTTPRALPGPGPTPEPSGPEDPS